MEAKPRRSASSTAKAAKKKSEPASRSKKAASRTSPAAKAPAKEKRPKSATRVAKKKSARAPTLVVKTPKGTMEVLRRAIFIDVENTSNERDLTRAIEELKIDRSAQPTELMAVGNWRSVASTLARRLAGLGAQLVHSAPPTGVRDWSDLWIAVSAGRWLATARPGDVLEIVSEDRAFDAVADAAAATGVIFKRISWQTGREAAKQEEIPARRSRRGGRRRRRAEPPAPAAPKVPPQTVVEAAPPPAGPPSMSEEEAHAASTEQIRSTIARLAGGDPSRWINLDALANALKDAGFTRPPGSPRLITRLRRIKDVEVHPDGAVRLIDDGQAHPQPSGESPVQRSSSRRRRRRRRPKGAGAGAPDSPGERTAEPAPRESHPDAHS